MRIMALAIGESTQSTRLVLSDLDGAIYSRTIIGEQIPKEYQPGDPQELNEFFKGDEGLREKLTAEGAAWHGPLTLARAIHIAKFGDTTVELALKKAIAQSEQARDYCIRLHRAARPKITG